jgi:hypothetical protein
MMVVLAHSNGLDIPVLSFEYYCFASVRETWQVLEHATQGSYTVMCVIETGLSSKLCPAEQGPSVKVFPCSLLLRLLSSLSSRSPLGIRLRPLYEPLGVAACLLMMTRPPSRAEAYVSHKLTRPSVSASA